jgi:hypothetical protein
MVAERQPEVDISDELVLRLAASETLTRPGLLGPGRLR